MYEQLHTLFTVVVCTAGGIGYADSDVGCTADDVGRSMNSVVGRDARSRVELCFQIWMSGMWTASAIFLEINADRR
ncbi:hypothetical protein [Phocaeicola acetigenes]|uniref:Uncharacterized protein n=1 Tax=Phocaeicola acetigenes TaxID=3016083 RepID=A0ABT4PGD1_9BACT|nr:hypothetical protein [Phocaeicola sp. KGMB11183]MCZ8372098.1 hypothetical protein [Phocaeicola sp. KGMB11183]